MDKGKFNCDLWKAASADLGFVITCPYALNYRAQEFLFVAHLPQFGAISGMLVQTEYDSSALEAALACNFGYSCVPETEEPYDRLSFIDLLCDWGWSAVSVPPPEWYKSNSQAE